jgi:hypothetical protein
MNWQEIELSCDTWRPFTDYLKDVRYVLVNDDNERHCYNDGWLANNSEIYVQKNSKTLVITVGESWTYGEGTEVINHRFHKWDIKDRIELTYSGKLAKILNSDLWTFACPGNSNSGIFTSLFRILDSVDTQKYNAIKVAIQMTACDREPPNNIGPTHLLYPLITHDTDFKHDRKIHLRDWFERYDEVWFDMLSRYIENSKLPLDVVLFKNFNNVWTRKRNYNFQILDTYWLEYNANWHNFRLPPCYVMHPDFYKQMQTFSIIDNFDFEFIMKDYNNWEVYTQFLECNNETNHACHPTAMSHALWTNYLLQKTKWKLIGKP